MNNIKRVRRLAISKLVTPIILILIGSGIGLFLEHLACEEQKQYRGDEICLGGGFLLLFISFIALTILGIAITVIDQIIAKNTDNKLLKHLAKFELILIVILLVTRVINNILAQNGLNNNTEPGSIIDIYLLISNMIIPPALIIVFIISYLSTPFLVWKFRKSVTKRDKKTLN